MHRCLLIDEILNSIFSWLEGATLCSLARTCRAFHEPATAIIWQRLIGLGPILRLLPGATATSIAESPEPDPESDERIYGLPTVVTRPLTLEEWLMVKRLSQRKPHSNSITPGSLSLLLHPPGDESPESLFPNVQRLIFHCQGHSPLEAVRWQDCVLTLLRILIRPQLSTLALFLDGRFCASLNASGILTSCSNVRALHTSATSFETQEGARMSIVPTISSFRSLETAKIHDVSWDVLASLAQIKTLQRLTIDFHAPLGSPPPLANDAFAGLHYLKTHIASLELSLRFFRWVRLGELRGLNVHTTDFARNDYSEDLEELLTLIPLHSPFLETIRVNLGSAPPRQPRHWVLTKSILTPYLSLHNLKVLDITLASRNYSPQLTDDDLAHMAQSWPLLKELHLKTYTCGWALPTRLSLAGIMALIYHCPDIEGLSLVFNAVQIPEIAYHPGGNLIQNTKIRSLQVGNSPISSPENVATYLRLLMPGLRTVSTCNTMDSTHQMHWMVVSTSLAPCTRRTFGTTFASPNSPNLAGESAASLLC
ncbi:hypothetical protein EDD17DRAFT_1896832 [Pisolithus thermaeus]|nr:hypothetical protein EDD17DRAFT_1896832 [Pisolithus thermaeus]